MNHKKSLVPVAVCLLLSFIGISMSRNISISMQDIFAALFTYALYAVLIALYLLRFVLIFLGVFVAYRLLRGSYSKRLAV
jgi:hypothetical protein